jgi:hypothetical protein
VELKSLFLRAKIVMRKNKQSFFLNYGVDMKSSKMVLLLAVTMMSAINAAKKPHVIHLEQIMAENFVNEKQQSLAHMVALHCNNPEFEFRIKPELFLKNVQAESQLHYPDKPKDMAFWFYMNSVLKQDPQETLFSQDADGMTPFDILEKHECKTELCHSFKKFVEKIKREKKELQEN